MTLTIENKHLSSMKFKPMSDTKRIADFKLIICVIFLLFQFFTLRLSAQIKSEKQFTVSGGFGYSNAVKNNTGSTSIWLQTDYKFYKSLSFAMEFENMLFKSPGVYTEFGFPPKLDVYDNLFLIGLKYQFTSKSKIAFSACSGWAFLIRQSSQITKSEFTDNNGNVVQTSFDWGTLTQNIYSIPLIIEATYPLGKRITAGLRVKYNNHFQLKDTYTCGLLVGLKL